MLLTIYTDGASRSNPGESASGFQILDENSRQLLEKAFYNGIRTNNEAEYIAIIAALEAAGSLYGFEN
ncbi:MAG: reverse transcriptase-like protein, partial [Candidatus Micrarchaeota archaeon]|nr:reverse transcriptase-like protein [Candidatus Micrarchaeota archaeon]